jgi:hypothetical protein
VRACEAFILHLPRVRLRSAYRSIACCDAPQLLHEKLAATSRQLALSERLVAALQSMLR